MMEITKNKNKEIVDMIEDGLKKNNGYCPCAIEQTPDTKCMCKEFREKIMDPTFEGYCHCQLYYKKNN